MTPKAQFMKRKIKFYSKENVCPVKDPVKRMKIQATEKRCANHISDKGLVSRIYNEFSKLSNKSQIVQLENGQKT